MKRRALIPLLGILAVAGLCWMLADPGASPVDPATAARGGHDGHGSTGETPPITARGPRGERTQDPRMPLGRAPGSAGAGGAVTVYGRCVDAETGHPLSGCEVRVATEPRRFRRPGTRPAGTAASARPAASARTAADGCFRLALDVPDGHHILLTTRMTGRADTRGYLARRRRDVDTGDIRIPFGTKVLVRVVDANDVPQPRVGFRLSRSTTGLRPKVAPDNWVVVESDDTGTIETGYLVAGPWRVIPTRRTRLTEPKGHFEIPTGVAIHEIRFVVELPDPNAIISGRLLDANGDAVPHVSIHADDGSKSPAGYGTSDSRGDFQVQCRSKPGGPVRLAVPRATGYEKLVTSERIPWGARDVLLTLQPAGNLRLEVVAAAGPETRGGTPVEEYQVVWYRIDDSRRGGHLGGRSAMARHPDGVSTVEAVPTGRILIVVTPKSREFAPNEPLEFTKDPGEAKVRVELRKRGALPLQVLDAANRPVSGTRVELLRSTDGRPVRLGAFAVEHGRYPQFSRRGSYVLLLDQAVTDDAGAAILRWPTSSDLLAIRVLGPGHVPLVHGPVAVGAGDAPIVIHVRKGATVRGAVRPMSVLKELTGSGSAPRGSGTQPPVVRLTYRGGDALPGRRRNESAPIDADGAFAFHGLANGRWDVTLRVWRFDANGRSRIAWKKFDSIELQPDEDRRLALDVTDLQPATLRGQVFVNGVPWARKNILLTRGTRDTDGRFARTRTTVLTTGDRGAFSATDLQPGLYVVGIDLGGGGRPGRVAADSVIEVAPGSTVDRSIRIASGELHVRVVDSAGKPVPGRFVAVRNKTTGFQKGVRTDRDGRIELVPASVGTYTIGVYRETKVEPGRLRAPRRNDLIELGEVTVAAGTRAGEATLTLPELGKSTERK